MSTVDIAADLVARARKAGLTLRPSSDGATIDIAGRGTATHQTIRAELRRHADEVREYLLSGREPEEDEPEPPVESRYDIQTSGYHAAEPPPRRPKAPTIADMIAAHPHMRPPVIHGLLRAGETMNIISAPKVGKSWLVTDLAIAVATGRRWLDTYETTAGDVLILDNELHGETTAHRVPRVADARGVPLAEYGYRVRCESLRGRGQSIADLAELLDPYEPGELRLVILDAFYRFIPAGADENANADVAALYNVVDQCADRWGVAFALIHHASKGNQSGKSITDVGAGAGSQSRATDTHLVLRPHETDGAFVLDAAVRSWAPIAPSVLRWTFPVFAPDPELDPAALRPERPRRRKAERKPDTEADAPPKAPQWTPARFAAEIVGTAPLIRESILERARAEGMTERHADRLFRLAEAEGHIHRHIPGPGERHRFASVPQSSLSDTHPPPTHAPPVPPVGAQGTPGGGTVMGGGGTRGRRKRQSTPEEGRS